MIYTTPPLASDASTKLGRFRLLSPNAGIRVSPLALGGMSLGESWDLGSMNRESSMKLLDEFFEAGGNFIDTANK
jgi:aryl-alcohol dehydrogenase-like predicted oxidoreductase